MSNEAFLILFLCLMALMTLFPVWLKKAKIPEVITLLIVGMVIGPNGLDLVGKLSGHLTIFGGEASQIANAANTFIDSLGSLGLLFLMTLAGMEADFKLLNTSKKPVIVLSIMTFLLPALSGFFIYRFFEAEDFAGQLLYASLFASHSVGIVFPIIRQLCLTRTVFGVTVLITTIVTDILSIILLGVSVQMKKVDSGVELTHKTMSIFDYIDPTIFGSWFILIFLAIVAVYFVVVMLLVPRVGKLILRVLPNGEDSVISCFILTILLTVVLGELLGINLIVGAFLAGLGLSRVIKNEEKKGLDLFHKMEGIGYGLLIPFLFVSIGMETNFRVLFQEWGNIWIVVATVIGLVGSKVLSGWISLKFCGFRDAAGFCAGFMTVPQLSATLAAAAIGKDLNMLNDTFFNAIVILSVVTTLPVPNIVRWIIVHYKLKFDHSPEDNQQGVAYELPEEESDELI